MRCAGGQALTSSVHELSRRSRPSLAVGRLAFCRGSRTVAGGARRSCVSSRRRDGRSGRAPFVSMMEATDLRDRHDGATAGRRDRTRNRRIFVQRFLRLVPYREDFELERGARTRPCSQSQDEGQEHRRHRSEAHPSSAATSTATTRTDFSVGTSFRFEVRGWNAHPRARARLRAEGETHTPRQLPPVERPHKQRSHGCSGSSDDFAY